MSKGINFAKSFSDFVNSGTRKDFEDFVTYLKGEHRTIQEDSFSLMFKYIEKLNEGYLNGEFDARNEYSCIVSNKITEFLRSEGF